ncbi:MAG TPA: Ada metal-binding domain-containing protein, partial [Gemmatimonadales bacterium]|nr:Ada metal-binding domain-containing protein [Gemmatimonadales bacterium]
MIHQSSVADADRWTAVLGRDASADGRFVYAVASTRIYCRPSCPSRRPNRRQVSFFPTPDAAEAKGYRACRRCHPRDIETDAVRRVREAQRYLDRHLDETVTLDRLGRAVGLSPYHLQRTFKALTGMSPRSYAGARRMERMKQGLRNGDTVSRATYDAGYSSPSRAYDHSSRRLGMTPGSYQRGGRGVRVRFTTVDTALGTVLVAATDRGLCSVTIGTSAAALEAGLRRE